MSGSPRCASPYLDQPPCQEQAGGQAGKGEALLHLQTPESCWQPSQNTPQHLCCSPKQGTPPYCAAPQTTSGHSGIPSASPSLKGVQASQRGLSIPEAVQASLWGSQHRWGAQTRQGLGEAGVCGQHRAGLSVCRALRDAINLERAGTAPAKNHIRCVAASRHARDQRPSSGGRRLHPHPFPLLLSTPPGTPLQLQRGCRDGSVGLSSALHPLMGQNTSVLGFYIRALLFAMASTASLWMPDPQLSSQQWEEEEGCGCGCKRYLSHLPVRTCTSIPSDPMEPGMEMG